MRSRSTSTIITVTITTRRKLITTNPKQTTKRKWYNQNTENMKSLVIFASFILFGISSCQAQGNKKVQGNDNSKNPYYSRTDTNVLKVSDAEWKRVLPNDVYQIARKKDTEYAFSGKYWDFEGIGTYYCAACGNPLFMADSKFSSTCGWPSFYETIRPKSVKYIPDNSHGMERTEVVCGRCDGHLGHLFDDGPAPTYKRFCMNSLMLDFEPSVKK